LFQRSVDRLVAVGTAVVPFMAAECDLPTAYSYHVATTVLGKMGTPEAVTALRKAVERSESASGQFGTALKTYAILGLALAGESDAVRLIEEGRWSGGQPVVNDMSLVELAAILTAPDSIPVLLEWLERYIDDEFMKPRLKFALRALGWIGDPSVTEAILALRHAEPPQLRREVMLALGNLGDAAAADTLFEALDDPDPEVRRAAAYALEILSPTSKNRELRSRLESAENVAVRRALYRTLATAGPSQLKTYREHWGREHPHDRLEIIRVVSGFQDPRGIDLLRAGLDDHVGTVIIAAAEGMSSLGTPQARDALLALLSNPDWIVASVAVAPLVELRERRAAPQIANRLLTHELSRPVDLRHRDEVRRLAGALVALDYVDALPALRAAAEIQSHPAIAAEIDSAIRRLAAVERRGNDVEPWVPLLHSERDDLRRLAIDRLASLGGPIATTALVASFDAASEPDRLLILDALGRTGSTEAFALLDRILTTEAFDAYSQRRLRSTAAWATRQIGGKKAIELLRRSVERRQGLDMDVLVYLAVLDGREAIPELRAYRTSRLLDLWWFRELEFKRTDRMVRALARRQGLTDLDRPPGEIHLGNW
jgi:HEAT repeat protein